MQTFQLSFTSRLHFAIFILSGIMLSACALGLLSYAGFGGLAEVICIGAVIYIFLKAGKFARQQASFFITEKNLRIEWGKGPWFTNKQNKELEWSSIASYKLEPDRLFDLFVLQLHSGEKLQFSISKLNDQEESFREFYRSFVSKIESFEIADKESNGSAIKKAKTFYETSFGIVFISVLALILIVSFVYSLFKY